MKILLTTLLVCFTFLETIVAQPLTKTIKGRVIDSEKEDGIAFVSIAVEGTYVGTASNMNGYFEITLPDNLWSQTLFFSAIGYKNKQFPITDLLDESFVVVTLEAQSYDIEEVNVEAQSKVLFRILRTASEKIRQNYLSGPFNLSYYYTDEMKSDQYRKNRQSIVKLYDETGFRDPSIRDAFQNRNYYFEQVKRNYEPYSFPDGKTGFDELLEADLVRMKSIVLNPHLAVDFKLNLEDKTIFNGDSIWVISYQTEKTDLAHTGSYYALSLQGKIYIRVNDYAILRNELHLAASKENPQGRSLAVKSGANKNVSLKTIIGYKEGKNGKLVPDFIQSERNYTDESGHRINYIQKAITIGIQASDPKQIEGRTYFENVKENEAFWDTFVAPHGQ